MFIDFLAFMEKELIISLRQYQSRRTRLISEAHMCLCFFIIKVVRLFGKPVFIRAYELKFKLFEVLVYFVVFWHIVKFSYFSMRYKNMNSALETNAIIPSVMKVKNGIASRNKLFTGTSLIMILPAMYSHTRKELNQSVKNTAFFLLISLTTFVFIQSSEK